MEIRVHLHHSDLLRTTLTGSSSIIGTDYCYDKLFSKKMLTKTLYKSTYNLKMSLKSKQT